MESKNTIIISAFPACGKSWCFDNLKDKYDMSDSDSSNFSWIRTINKNQEEMKVRNPDFPQNYIEHINKLIGVKDFVFVSSHDVVRNALKEANIPYFLIYPENTTDNKCIWIARMFNRKSHVEMIDFIQKNWDEFIEQMKMEEYPFHYVLGTEENEIFLNEKVLDDIKYVWDNINKENDIWGDKTFAMTPVSPFVSWS